MAIQPFKRQPHKIVGNKKNFSVKTQKGESQNGGNTKTKHAKFSEKRTFLTTYQVVGDKLVRNVRFSENLACFVFLLPQFWDFTFCLITDNFTKKSVRKMCEF